MKHIIVTHSNDDFTPIFMQLLMLHGNDTVFEFETGEYHFWPDKQIPRELYISNTDSKIYPDKMYGLLLEDKKNIHFKGKETTFVFHGKMGAIALLNCENIEFEYIAIAYACPSVIDVEVVEAEHDAEKTLVKVKIPSVYQWELKNKELHWQSEINPYTQTPYWTGVNGLDLSQQLVAETGFVTRVDEDLFFQAEKMEQAAELLVITYGNHRHIENGDVFQMRHTDREVTGLFIEHSRQVKFKKIDFNYLHGMGVIGQFSEDLVFEACNFEAQAGSFSASGADMIHLSSCRGQVTVAGCNFRNPHDDMINIHGTFLRVEELNGCEAIVSYQHHQTLGFDPFMVGDQAEFYSGESLLSVGGPYEVLKSERVSSASLTKYRITFSKPLAIELTKDLIVDNISATTNVLVEHCRFYQCPIRAVLVTSRGEVIIRNNHFEKIHLACISITCDGNEWFESGPVKNVLIKDNYFVDCREELLLISPPNTVFGAKKVHENIRLENNQTSNLGQPLMTVRSVAGVRLKNNYDKQLGEINLTHISQTESEIIVE